MCTNTDRPVFSVSLGLDATVVFFFLKKSGFPTLLVPARARHDYFATPSHALGIKERKFLFLVNVLWNFCCYDFRILTRWAGTSSLYSYLLSGQTHRARTETHPPCSRRGLTDVGVGRARPAHTNTHSLTRRDKPISSTSLTSRPQYWPVRAAGLWSRTILESQ